MNERGAGKRRLEFWVSDEEHAAWKEASALARKSMAAWIRDACNCETGTPTVLSHDEVAFVRSMMARAPRAPDKKRRR